MRIIILSVLVLGAFINNPASAGSMWDTIVPWGGDGSNDDPPTTQPQLGNMVDSVDSDPQGLPEAVAVPSYARGVADSAKSLMKIKAHEPHPTGMSSHIGRSGEHERSGRR